MSGADEVFCAVRDVPLLKGLSDAQIGLIAAKAQRLVFEAGDILLSQDDVCEAATIIVDGQATCVDGTAAIAGEQVGRGAVLAEMAMVVDIQASSTVVAQSRIKALRIHQSDLIAELSANRDISERLIEEVTLRLRDVAADLRSIEQSLSVENAPHEPGWLASRPFADSASEAQFTH